MFQLSIGTNDFERAVAFYDQVLATLGCKRLMEHPGAIADGKQYPEFWVGTPIDTQPATVSNGTHIGFIASTKEAVHAFYKATLAVGDRFQRLPSLPMLAKLTSSRRIAVGFQSHLSKPVEPEVIIAGIARLLKR